MAARNDILDNTVDTLTDAINLVGRPLDYVAPVVEDDYDSAYLRLNSKQQMCVELMARLDDPMTITAVALAAKVEVETLNTWRRSDRDFQQAMDELQKPFFISILKSLSRADLVKRYLANDKTLSREDRVLAMKISGDYGSDVQIQTNVQVNLAKKDW